MFAVSSGLNGSGKTTTLGMILDIIFPDSGTFEWFGGRYGQYPRRHTGALLETPNFYPYPGSWLISGKRKTPITGISSKWLT